MQTWLNFTFTCLIINPARKDWKIMFSPTTYLPSSLKPIYYRTPSSVGWKSTLQWLSIEFRMESLTNLTNPAHNLSPHTTLPQIWLFFYSLNQATSCLRVFQLAIASTWISPLRSYLSWHHHAIWAGEI
jgi:hypothetical protein